MGVLNEGHFSEELENEVKLELGFEKEPNFLAIVDAVKLLLQGLGEDIDREGIKKTPFRVAKALREGTRGYRLNADDIVQSALFPEAGLDNGIGHAGGAGGLVVVRDLDLFSYCESCLLPFQVKCHVGYIPSDKQVVGLSKFSRVADVFAKRLQDPQRLSDEICSALHHGIKPSGVAVLLQCSHIHFPNLETFLIDSNHQGWVKSIVCSGLGVFEDEKDDFWNDFLCLLRFRGINLDTPVIQNPVQKSWCPSISSSKTNLGMVNAVSSIIKCLGEDPSRNELVGTPNRFVKWLLNFEKDNLEMKNTLRLDCQASCYEETNLDMKPNGFSCGKMNSLKLDCQASCYKKTNLDKKPNGFSYGEMYTSKHNGQASGDEKKLCSEFNLPFWSQCEHHLLPFHGVVHIGYFGGKIVNYNYKSSFESIVHFHGFKLQVQERLTRQIAESVSTVIGRDVMVVVEANHTCMISRGIEKFGSSTATIAVLGRFSTDADARASFLKSIPKTTSFDG